MIWMTIMAKGLKSNIKWEKKPQNSTYSLILDFFPQFPTSVQYTALSLGSLPKHFYAYENKYKFCFSLLFTKKLVCYICRSATCLFH